MLREGGTFVLGVSAVILGSILWLCLLPLIILLEIAHWGLGAWIGGIRSGWVRWQQWRDQI